MTTPRQRRRYPKAQKAALVLLADQTSIRAAAASAELNESTVRYWMDKPEFAQLRARARESMAEEVLVVARKGWELLAERLGTFEPRDLIDLVEMATTKGLLMSGEATARTEQREITDADAIAVAAISELVGAALAGSSALVSIPVEPGRNGADPNGLH